MASGGIPDYPWWWSQAHLLEPAGVSTPSWPRTHRDRHLDQPISAIRCQAVGTRPALPGRLRARAWAQLQGLVPQGRGKETSATTYLYSAAELNPWAERTRALRRRRTSPMSTWSKQQPTSHGSQSIMPLMLESQVTGGRVKVAETLPKRVSDRAGRIRSGRAPKMRVAGVDRDPSRLKPAGEAQSSPAERR